MVEKAAVPEKDWNLLFDEFFSQYSKEPEDHKIVLRLSLVQYELRQYAEALERAKEAARLSPDCPLATWAKACAIQMLNRHHDSLSLFKQLTKIKPETLSKFCCVGGKARANGLIADAIYRMSLSLQAVGREQASLQLFSQHLDCRRPGCYSIYPLEGLPGFGGHIRSYRPLA